MQVAELLASEDIKLATAAAGILIHAAAPMLQSESSAGEASGLAAKLKPLLLQLCSSGAPKAAKVAIRYCCSGTSAAGPNCNRSSYWHEANVTLLKSIPHRGFMHQACHVLCPFVR